MITFQDYIIMYELNEGTNASSNPLIYNKEAETIKLAEATREDYIFGGWYTDEACTTEKTEIAKGSSGDITLYAKWIARTLEQRFEAGYSVENVNQDGVSYSTTGTGYGVVTVKAPDSTKSVWDYYVRSKDVKFEVEKNYTVSVDLKADKASVVAIAAARADMFFTVGTEWTTCTFETGYLETAISNEDQKCITIGSGLVGTLSISNLVITEIEGNDNLPTLSFFIEKAGIDTYLASNFTTKNIIEVEEAKDDTGTKPLGGYKLKLNSTHVSLQLRDYAPVSGNKLNKAIFNLKTDNSELNSAVVASVASSSGYVNCWNKASVIGTSGKDCEVCFPSYSEKNFGVEECAVEGIISKDANNGITEQVGNTITITNFSITNVTDLADTGKTFAIKKTENDSDIWSKSSSVPFYVDVTIPANNHTVFDVLLGNKVEEGKSFNWDDVTRFLYQKKSEDKIDGSSCIQYLIEGSTDNPTYKLVNTSTESDVTCRITLTKDLKVEITECLVLDLDSVDDIKKTIKDYIDEAAEAGSKKTIKVDGEISEGSTVMADICTAFKNGFQEARINLDLSGVTGLSEIPESAFEDCKNLVSITIPAGVNIIGANAFSGCTALEEVYFMETDVTWNLMDTEITVVGTITVSTDAKENARNLRENSSNDWDRAIE